ncbi:MAG: hypothetical protein KF686_17155 [Ramlibacter sp.]|nr:hypothetical protein [Ramlibacter sp.]
MKQSSNVSRLLAYAVATFSALAALAAHAQTTKPSDGQAVSWPSVTCKGQPGVCDRQEAKGILFAQPGQTKVVLISHGSQGVDSAASVCWSGTPSSIPRF